MSGPEPIDPAAAQAACIEALAGAQQLALGAVRDGIVVHASAALRRMFALPEGAPGGPFAELAAPEERARLAATLAAADGAVFVFRARRTDGSTFEAELRAVGGALPDGPATVLALSDLTERDRGTRELSYLALVDPASGLPNRQAFLDRLQSAVSGARRSGRAAAALLVGLDASATPDETTLREAGERLARCLRETDTLARTAVAEFGVLLPRLDRRDRAALPAERILAALADLTNGRASIGIAAYPDDASSVESLLERAAAALGEVRRGGGQRFAFAQPGGTPDASPPSFVQWSTRYEVGVAIVDGQHRELVELINRLGDGLRSGHDYEELVDALKDLVRYTEHHFATEERLMDELGARSERHRDEHRRLLDGLMKFTLRLDAEGVSHSAGFLQDWLFRHIDEVDRPFAAFLRNHGVS